MTAQPTPKNMHSDTLWQDAETLLEAPFLLAAEYWLSAAEAFVHAPHPHTYWGAHPELVVSRPFDPATEPGLFA